MRFKPHEYQERAIAFVKDHPHCALFLDMGLGKTVSTLTAIRDLMDEADITKTLVIAPRKVAESTWGVEAEKWDHLKGLRVSKVMGTEKKRLEALEAKADIYVISRDNVVWLVDHYRNKPPYDCIVVDELTSFKSHQAKRFKALRKWTASVGRVVGLTGTPVPNSMLDLWAQIYTIDGGQRLGKFITHYRDTYFRAIPIGQVATKYELKPGADKVILERIGDICLTMQAKDYLTLPKCVEIDDFVELPSAVMDKYKSFERDQVLLYREAENSGTVIADGAASLMNKLSQFSNGAVYDEQRAVHEIHAEKIERLKEIIETSDSPVLVFYQYQHDRDRILKAVKSAKQYDGDEDLRAWNRGEIQVLLAHPASTAYGLNMQHGGHVIVWFSTGWNLEQYQQANARLHRQGQQRPVVVYRLMCRGTVDEVMARALNGKTSTQQMVIDILKRY